MSSSQYTLDFVQHASASSGYALPSIQQGKVTLIHSSMKYIGNHRGNAVELPKEGYRGSEILTVAKSFFKLNGNKFANKSSIETSSLIFKEYGITYLPSGNHYVYIPEIEAGSYMLNNDASSLEILCNEMCDTYINVDPGTMSPYQYGEVFASSDGDESDFNLVYYERFTDEDLTRHSNITARKFYQALLKKERDGIHEGKTVQVVPPATGVMELKSIFSVPQFIVKLRLLLLKLVQQLDKLKMKQLMKMLMLFILH
uniref:CTP synthase n=1 Tax=Eufriesea mexicana TaxID=516756 RepID=A0A310SLV3_9HYME